MSNFIRDQQQNQKPDIQFQQHTQRRLPISIKMQTPGKATRRRSPCCTVNPLRNALLSLLHPPTPGARLDTLLPSRLRPGQLSTTTWHLPSSPNLPFPLLMEPKRKKAITVANKGSTLQQRGLASPCATPALPPLSVFSPVQPGWLPGAWSISLQ